MRNGQVLHVLSGSGSRGVFPNIDAVTPRAVLASAPRPVTLSGANLAVPDNAVLARCQGALLLAVPVYAVHILWQACYPCWKVPFCLRACLSTARAGIQFSKGAYKRQHLNRCPLSAL